MPNKLTTITGRLTFYTASWLLYDAVAQSNANLVNDPSSMAWVGFLPFIFPIFFIQGAVYAGPVAIVTEITIAVVRWKRNYNESTKASREIET